MVEHDDPAGIGRFVNQMGGPQNTERARAAQRLDMLQKKLAALHIKADSGFIE